MVRQRRPQIASQQSSPSILNEKLTDSREEWRSFRRESGMRDGRAGNDGPVCHVSGPGSVL